MRHARLNMTGVVFLALTAIGATTPVSASDGAVAFRPAPLPERLDETGLFVPGTTIVAPGVIAYSPQYPLWSDGASKRRWLTLPPGASIDATRADAWVFPAGTKLWKEFRHGRAIETRYIERLGDGSWRFAAYTWDAGETAARLAPADGLELDVPAAPGGRYAVPSRDDCRACHDGAAVPVLGVSALQLSPDRDDLAPHADRPAPGDADLRELVARGLITNLPDELLDSPPRIEAPTPVARAALGYLHANCGHCHNRSGPMLLVDMVLDQSGSGSTVTALGSLVGHASDFRAYGLDTRIVPGRPEQSVLVMRMRSRNPILQMPPLGTQIPDAEGVALVEGWIRHELSNEQESLE